MWQVVTALAGKAAAPHGHWLLIGGVWTFGAARCGAWVMSLDGFVRAAGAAMGFARESFGAGGAALAPATGVGAVPTGFGAGSGVRRLRSPRSLVCWAATSRRWVSMIRPVSSSCGMRWPRPGLGAVGWMR